MIEPVIQRRTGDIDAVIAHLGEIGKPQPSWRNGATIIARWRAKSARSFAALVYMVGLLRS